MLVCVCGLMTGGLNYLEYCVDPDTLVRIQIRTLPINQGLWQINWIDATGEKLGRIIVLGFIIGNFGDCVSLCNTFVEESIPSAPAGPLQFEPVVEYGGQNV